MHSTHLRADQPFDMAAIVRHAGYTPGDPDPFIPTGAAERVFAWEDKFRRLLVRFERLNQLHFC